MEDLAKSFPVRGSRQRVQAVEGVSFAIAAGETLGLVGESGSGKTTVGRCLLRLVEPDRGTIQFAGEELTGLDSEALRRLRARLQIVFQDPFDQLNPRWRIRDVLREPLDLHAQGLAAERNGEVGALLDRVGVPREAAEARPAALSAGLQQRVAIARALASRPALIVLDEPTSALAPAARAAFVALLRELQDELGLSYLFISHDLTTVRSLCHRVAVMYLGQVVEIGTRDEIFEQPLHPYSRALLASHLAPDPWSRRVDRPIQDELAGEIPSPIDLPVGCYLAGRCPVEIPERCRSDPQSLSPTPREGRLVRCWRAREVAEASKPLLVLQAGVR